MPLVLIREDPVLHVCQPPRQVVTHAHTTQAVNHPDAVDHLQQQYRKNINNRHPNRCPSFLVFWKKMGWSIHDIEPQFRRGWILSKKHQMFGQEFNTTLGIEHTRLKMLNTT